MYYKLTTQELTTHNDFKWELGVPAPLLSGDKGLCSDTLYHCYTSPLLAVLLNPIHANYKSPRLFEIAVEGEGVFNKGLKAGFPGMTLCKEIPLPVFTIAQKVAFAILCALEVCEDGGFKTWAGKWLSGEDRTAEAAAEARASAEARAAEARAAEVWASTAEARAAEARAAEAWAAAWAEARAARAARAAEAWAARAAWAEAWAAEAAEAWAAWAAEVWAARAAELPLHRLAEKALMF